MEPTGNIHSNTARINIGDGTPNSVGEKRTRFSLTHDDGSIGNTSDNLEAISEAASNHSVASSLEDEVDQDNVDPDDPLQIIDNLSDMVSANVSGRGTPNVSGRDTPSSQVTEGEEPARLLAAEREPEEAERAPMDLMGEPASPGVPGLAASPIRSIGALSASSGSRSAASRRAGSSPS